MTVSSIFLVCTADLAWGFDALRVLALDENGRYVTPKQVARKSASILPVCVASSQRAFFGPIQLPTLRIQPSTTQQPRDTSRR